MFSLLISACSKNSTNVDITEYYWNVTVVQKPGEQKPTIANGNYIVRFDTNGTFTLQLDVNGCGGSYSLGNKGSITFSNLFCTHVCCDSQIGEPIAEILPTVRSYSFKGNYLILKGDGILKLKGTKL